MTVEDEGSLERFGLKPRLPEGYESDSYPRRLKGVLFQHPTAMQLDAPFNPVYLSPTSAKSEVGIRTLGNTGVISADMAHFLCLPYLRSNKRGYGEQPQGWPVSVCPVVRTPRSPAHSLHRTRMGGYPNTPETVHE